MTSNVVLVTVDALRSDFVGYLGADTGSTPNIDEIADNGLACTRAYANSIPTYFAFQSVFGGRCDINTAPPLGIPVEWGTVADIFSSEGYDTAGFNAANPWLTAEFNYDSGFDTFEDFLQTGTDKMGSGLVKLMKEAQHRIPEYRPVRDKVGLAARAFCSFTNNFPSPSADIVTAKAVEWLSNRDNDDPFFLWVHYMDPHYPWTPDSDDISRWEIAKTWHKVSHVYNNSNKHPDSSTIADAHRLYASEVSNVDDSIETLITYLEQRGMYDETIVCITADHGTELGDHGGFSHGPDSLYEEIVHIPLVVSGPDVPQETITEPVQHVDIPVTLVDVANLDTTAPEVNFGWTGNPLIRQQRDSVLLQVIYDYDPTVDSNTKDGILHAIVDYPWKLHWNEPHDSVELYNLIQDPDEKEDLSRTDPETVEALKCEIRSKHEDIQVSCRTASEIVAVRQRIDRLELP